MKQNAEGKTGPNAVPALAKEEIEKKIAEAKQNPKNFAFQKELGLALYRYSVIRKDRELLAAVVELLERANKINPDDNEVVVSLGNAHFDIGRGARSNLSLKRSRVFYRAALEKNSKNVNVRNNLGLTYYFSNPPEYERALTEYQIALKNDPNHERSLQLITQVLLKLKHKKEASKYLKTLAEINPQNPLIGEFRKQVSEEIK